MFVCGKNQYFQLNKPQNSNINQYINPPIEFHINPSLISSFSTNFQQTVWITHEGKSYVTGDNRNGIISGSLPKKILPVDTEFSLKDQHDHPFKFISVVCGAYFTLYLVSDESGNFHLVFCYSDQTPNPLFLNIGQITPRTLFGGYYTSGVIDTDGGVIVLKRPLFRSPTAKIETNFLPHGDKAVKIACCYSFFICLGESSKIYMTQISGTLPIKFEEVEEFHDKIVVDVSGSYDFCFVVLNDGRVFGQGSNWHCKLGFPEKISSVSSFTEIESLRKYKIVSAFTGSSHSIFKSYDGKMIVCGYNNSGELFLSPKEIIFPPEEVDFCNGFSFCATGDSSSVAFVGIDPPKNISNKKISKINADEIVIHKHLSNDDTKIDELMKKLALKEEEILILKKENSELKSIMMKDKEHIDKLEKENKELNNKTMKKEKK